MRYRSSYFNSLQLGRGITLANTSGQTVETITASREHPFFVEGKGFVPAGGLAIGNSIVTRAGPSLVVKAVKWNRCAEGYAVYNFVVEEEHTYFVGLANGGARVHNIDCLTTPGQLVPRNLKALAEKAFDDSANLANMTDAQREAAAQGYEAIAQMTKGPYADLTRLYNLERAAFLRGEVSSIQPKAIGFGIERGLIPPPYKNLLPPGN